MSLKPSNRAARRLIASFTLPIVRASASKASALFSLAAMVALRTSSAVARNFQFSHPKKTERAANARVATPHCEDSCVHASRRSLSI